MSTHRLEELVDRAGRSGDLDSLRDRYRATLLGAAAGNALGLPVEGASRTSIRRHWPEGLRDIAPQELERPWDDDLAQTVVVAEVQLEDPDLDPDRLGAGLLAWSRDNGRGIGQLMSLVMSELASGTSALEAARNAWERSGWSTAGNGAIARCSPVALRWRSSGRHLLWTARTSALVTHYDPRCEWSTAAMASSLAIALGGGAVDPQTVAEALSDADHDGWAAEAVDQVVEVVRAVPERLEDLDLDDPMDMGYTLKAMAVGLWSLARAGDDFESALVRVVQAGGDTDTNACVAGAALGARLGTAAIPDRWLDHVRDRQRLESLADRLFEAAAGDPTGN